MRAVLTAEEMRAADARAVAAGTPARELMERAGAALAAEILREGGRKILVLAGGGNNGGDGYVCARLLSEAGADAAVCPVFPPKSRECLRARAAYAGPIARSFADVRADVVVDCLLGTGFARAPEGGISDAIAYINGSRARVYACDVPSGLDGTSGLAPGAAVRADVTVCMGQYKAGLFLNDGLDLAGEVRLADIGIAAGEGGALLADAGLVRSLFPPRRRNTHKGSYGRATLIAGSRSYPGAALLSAHGLAALRAGCGYACLAAPAGLARDFAAAVPECVAIDLPGADGLEFCPDRLDEIMEKSDSVAFGMGLGQGEGVFRSLDYLLRRYRGRLIVDADGINVLSRAGAEALKGASCAVALTPHVGEFARLTRRSAREVAAEGIGAARAFAAEYGVTVALKSASTWVTDGARAILSARGTSALAKGGSGDTLSGLAAGIAAREKDLTAAMACASWLLGRSAEIVGAEMGEYAPVAREIAAALPRALKAAEAEEV